MILHFLREYEEEDFPVITHAKKAGMEDDAIEDALCAGTKVLENSIQNYLKS